MNFIKIFNILLILFMIFIFSSSLLLENNLNNKLNMIMGFVSYPDSEKAKNAAKLLVEKDLAACVKVLDNLSVYYKWDNKLNEDKESYLIIKSLDSKVKEIQSFLKENHPYEVYEFIYTKVESGNEDYFKWVETNLINVNKNKNDL